MIKLNIDKVQVRYITGINKCLDGYPTPLDVLYESCLESVDDALFSPAKIENRYFVDETRVNEIIKYLVDNGYVIKDKSKYKIVNTPWL